MSLHAQGGRAAVIDVSVSDILAGLDLLGISVVITDRAGTVLVWSDSSTALFGRSADQALGASAEDVTAPEDPERRIRTAAVLAGPNRDLVLSLAVEADDGTAGSAGLHDRLTGLPNRAYLLERLEQWQQPDRSIAVLFLDIDHFKLVNDNRGHAVGDQLLRAIADRLTATCEPTDVVARLGDDEFAVMRRDAGTAEARELAGEICRMLDEPCDVGGTRLAVRISIGVASTEDVAAADLLQSAERALHWAKAGGRGRVEVHDASMRGSTEGRLQLLADLRQAIETDTLAMHYQPSIQSDGGVVGVEALLRWEHPRLGNIPPSDIVPLAEDNGLMPALGAWILERACTDIARSPDPAVRALHVAVNLSTRQLADPAIVETVRGALVRTGLPAGRLVLEVTETSVIANPEATSRQLHALKLLGVRLALDDFGTGYSSLVYVRRFPIDIIKIDRTFITGMTHNSDDCAIVASLISLAGAVGLEVVAEGVETADQADLLRRLGCTYAQGYLWSKAVPVTELARIVRPGVLRGWAQEQRAGWPSPTLGSHSRGRILAMHRTGASPNTIAAALNSDGERTPQGARWHATTVARVILGGTEEPSTPQAG
jgi:diguanylate cyclase (GGDEF)-like protein